MRKVFELKEGCMARAFDNEPTFVLLARDVAAPAAIRAWVAERLRLGKNTVEDAQLIEALHCANLMEMEQQGWHKEARMDKLGITQQDIAETMPERP